MRSEILLQTQFLLYFDLTMTMRGWAPTNLNLHIPHCLFYVLLLYMYKKSCLFNSRTQIMFDFQNILRKLNPWILYIELFSWKFYSSIPCTVFLSWTNWWGLWITNQLLISNHCTLICAGGQGFAAFLQTWRVFFSYWWCGIFHTILSGGRQPFLLLLNVLC